jgi:hypothetical protein
MPIPLDKKAVGTEVNLWYDTCYVKFGSPKRFRTFLFPTFISILFLTNWISLGIIKICVFIGNTHVII